MKVFKPWLESSANNLLGNIVLALKNPLRNPRNSDIIIEQRQEPKLNLVTKRLPKGNFPQIAFAGQVVSKAKL
jgi:hypothetical protein